MVQLRTRQVRLPVPTQRQLDSARKILSSYEEQGLLLRGRPFQLWFRLVVRYVYINYTHTCIYIYICVYIILHMNIKRKIYSCIIGSSWARAELRHLRHVSFALCDAAIGRCSTGCGRVQIRHRGAQRCGKGGGELATARSCGAFYASITKNVASDWKLWEQIFKSPLKNHEARIAWVLFEDVWTLGSELVFLFFGGWLYIL